MSSTHAVRNGCLKVVTILGAVILLVTLALRELDESRAPWAYGNAAQRLNVQWLAAFTTPNGRHGAMYLDLSGAAVRSNNAGVKAWRRGLYGKGQVCGVSRLNTEFVADGAANASGSDVAIRPRWQDLDPVGWHFSMLRGAFKPGDLRLLGGLSLGGGAPRTNAQTEWDNREMSAAIHFHFGLGTRQQFDAACASLAASKPQSN
jgi:hypothetical protein